MAIGVKVMKRPGAQASYLRATLKGMALTFSHLWRPKVTMQYPEEKSSKDWTLSPRWRGTHRMLTDEGDVPRARVDRVGHLSRGFVGNELDRNGQAPAQLARQEAA